MICLMRLTIIMPTVCFCVIKSFPFKAVQKVYNYNSHGSIGRHDKP